MPAQDLPDKPVGRKTPQFAICRFDQAIWIDAIQGNRRLCRTCRRQIGITLSFPTRGTMLRISSSRASLLIGVGLFIAVALCRTPGGIRPGSHGLHGGTPTTHSGPGGAVQQMRRQPPAGSRHSRSCRSVSAGRRHARVPPRKTFSAGMRAFSYSLPINHASCGSRDKFRRIFADFSTPSIRPRPVIRMSRAARRAARLPAVRIRSSSAVLGLVSRQRC